MKLFVGYFSHYGHLCFANIGLSVSVIDERDGRYGSSPLLIKLLSTFL
jgi:hypothetical protein